MSSLNDLARQSVLFDASPLQDLIVLHYARQVSKPVKSLFRKTCSPLAEVDPTFFDQIVAQPARRYFTQLGLAEALHFRSGLRDLQAEIRKFAFDAIRLEEMAELHISAAEYLGGSSSIVSGYGLTDFVHSLLMRKDEKLLILTDDGDFRGAAGNMAHRVVVRKELLEKELGRP